MNPFGWGMSSPRNFDARLRISTSISSSRIRLFTRVRSACSLVLIPSISPWSTRSWRTQEGKSKREIVRCLKRYIACEVFRTLRNPSANPVLNDLRPERESALDTHRRIRPPPGSKSWAFGFNIITSDLRPLKRSPHNDRSVSAQPDSEGVEHRVGTASFGLQLSVTVGARNGAPTPTPQARAPLSAPCPSHCEGTLQEP